MFPKISAFVSSAAKSLKDNFKGRCPAIKILSGLSMALGGTILLGTSITGSIAFPYSIIGAGVGVTLMIAGTGLMISGFHDLISSSSKQEKQEEKEQLLDKLDIKRRNRPDPKDTQCLFGSDNQGFAFSTGWEASLND